MSHNVKEEITCNNRFATIPLPLKRVLVCFPLRMVLFAMLNGWDADTRPRLSRSLRTGTASGGAGGVWNSSPTLHGGCWTAVGLEAPRTVSKNRSLLSSPSGLSGTAGAARDGVGVIPESADEQQSTAIPLGREMVAPALARSARSENADEAIVAGCCHRNPSS